MMAQYVHFVCGYLYLYQGGAGANQEEHKKLLENVTKKGVLWADGAPEACCLSATNSMPVQPVKRRKQLPLMGHLLPKQLDTAWQAPK